MLWWVGGERSPSLRPREEEVAARQEGTARLSVIARVRVLTLSAASRPPSEALSLRVICKTEEDGRGRSWISKVHKASSSTDALCCQGSEPRPAACPCHPNLLPAGPGRCTSPSLSPAPASISPPWFPLGPVATLSILSSLPFIPFP